MRSSTSDCHSAQGPALAVAGSWGSGPSTWLNSSGPGAASGQLARSCASRKAHAPAIRRARGGAGRTWVWAWRTSAAGLQPAQEQVGLAQHLARRLDVTDRRSGQGRQQAAAQQRLAATPHQLHHLPGTRSRGCRRGRAMSSADPGVSLPDRSAPSSGAGSGRCNQVAAVDEGRSVARNHRRQRYRPPHPRLLPGVALPVAAFAGVQFHRRQRQRRWPERPNGRRRRSTR